MLISIKKIYENSLFSASNVGIGPLWGEYQVNDSKNWFFFVNMILL